jgi:O-antigen ligase
MLLTTFIASLFMKMPWKRKLVYILFAILAFVASIRIQSRTGVVILVIVVVLSLLANFRTMARRNFIMVVISLGALLFAANYALTTNEEELGILDRFQDDDVETGGYRTELAMDVVNKLSESPWGGLEHMPYAHNMWLDCARVSGIVPLLLLLLITVLYARSMWRMYKQPTDNSSYRDVIVIIGIALFVYMNVEPILEGCPLLFAFFVIFLGILRGKTNRVLHYR